MIANTEALDLQRLRGVMPKKKQPAVDIDPVEEFSRHDNMFLLEKCRNDWESLRDFRARRKRARRYLRGDQWGDLITDPDTGQLITEEDYIKKQGKVPLKQNQIRQLMKNLLGQFRQNVTKAIVLSRQSGKGLEAEMMSYALEYVHQTNQTPELDARLFEEFGVSGSAIQKLTYRFIKERDIEDIWLENKNPAMMFFNTDVRDIRMTDLRRIGEIIDITMAELISVFARTPEDVARIRACYTDRSAEYFYSNTGLSANDVDNLDFYFPRNQYKCRVIEVWELKSGWRTYAHDFADGSMSIVPYSLDEVRQININRVQKGMAEGIPVEEIPQIDANLKYEQFWWVKFLTPWGDLLYESETVYEHQEHPFIMRLYPLLDGEVWGFIEDIIDQQRYINRLIILLDFIIGASAKGVLMIPESAIGRMSPDEWASEWTKFNGMILYKDDPKHPDSKPFQISANSTNIGAHELLQLQMQLMQEISGIHSAIQGMDAKAGTAASLYAQQAQNATLNSTDYMMFFNGFQQARDYKILKLIKQFYKEDRYMAISGNIYSEAAKLFQPEKVANMQFDIMISQAKDTPAYKALIEDTLKELLMGQLIDLDMYLENSSLPFADRLRDSLKKRQEATAGQPGMEGAGMPGMPQIPPDIQAQIQQGANPKAMAMLNQATGKGKYDNL
jgi:hypothetical protein